MRSAFASRANRFVISADAFIPDAGDLSANVLPTSSLTSHTPPIPPRPSGATSVYLPSCTPGSKARPLTEAYPRTVRDRFDRLVVVADDRRQEVTTPKGKVLVPKRVADDEDRP